MPESLAAKETRAVDPHRRARPVAPKYECSIVGSPPVRTKTTDDAVKIADAVLVATKLHLRNFAQRVRTDHKGQSAPEGADHRGGIAQPMGNYITRDSRRRQPAQGRTDPETVRPSLLPPSARRLLI